MSEYLVLRDEVWLRDGLWLRDGVRQCDARRGFGYLLTSFFLSAVSVLLTMSARAEAPPSQEFWNYMIEFGDTQGEVFDPADYATVVSLPDKARAEFSRAQVNSTAEATPSSASIVTPTSASIVTPASTSRLTPASTLREAPAVSPTVNSAQEQPQ
jgi:hypothetical protein